MTVKTLLTLTAALAVALIPTRSKAFNPEHLKQLLQTKQCAGCDLSSANLRGVQLQGANLEKAILVGADLRNANLQGAIFRGTNLTNADLRKANLTNVDWRDALFTNALGIPDNIFAGKVRFRGMLLNVPEPVTTNLPIIEISQSSCVTGTPLQTLLPNQQFPLTISDKPAIFLYIPKTSAEIGEFVLKDENSVVISSRIKLPKNPGIVSIVMTENANIPFLQINKNYQWSFAIICNSQARDKDIFVSGGVRRISPNSSLASQLQRASKGQLAVIYGEYGIWYDLLAALAELRRSYPQDPTILNAWVKLLKSVGLEKIATEPLLEAVIFSPEVIPTGENSPQPRGGVFRPPEVGRPGGNSSGGSR